MQNNRTPIKVSDRVKWADPAVARDYWDPDKSDRENLEQINGVLNTLHVVTDISKDEDGSVTMIEVDYATQILPREAFRSSCILSLNPDPDLLKQSLGGQAIINIRTQNKIQCNSQRNRRG